MCMKIELSPTPLRHARRKLSAYYLSIKTLKIISRRNYTTLPVVPDATLEHINAIAAA